MIAFYRGSNIRWVKQKFGETFNEFSFINPRRIPSEHIWHIAKSLSCSEASFVNELPTLFPYDVFPPTQFITQMIFQNGIVCNCNDHIVKLGGSFKYNTRTGSLLQLNSQLPGLNLAATAARRSEKLKIEASSSLDDNQTVKLVLKR